MAVQTYCDQDDIESLISSAGLNEFIDDDEDAVIVAGETAFVTDAIEMAAVEINAAVGRRYKLADVTANAWLKWANATLAAFYLVQRRLNGVPSNDLVDRVDRTRTHLEDLRKGQFQLPEQAESFDDLPTVTNYAVETYRHNAPVRVRTNESTGGAPPSGVMRKTARTRRDD